MTKLLTAIQYDIGNLTEDVSYIALLDVILCISILQNLKLVGNDDGDGNNKGKTRTGINKTTTLHVHHSFFTFLRRRCTTTT